MRTLLFWLGWMLLLCGTLGAMYSVTVVNSQIIAPFQQAAALAGAAGLALAFASLRRRHPASIRPRT